MIGIGNRYVFTVINNLKQVIIVVDKTFKGIQVLRDSINKRYFVHQFLGPNILSAFFLSFKKEQQ